MGIGCGLGASAATTGNPSTEFQSESGYRWRALSLPGAGHTGFSVVASDQTGIRFTNTVTDASVGANRILENGSGAAAGDVDGDGRCDLYFCSLQSGNALYRNLGDWKFENITQISHTGCEGQPSTGAVLADVDGDGDLDLLVNSLGGGTRLFINDGKGQFTESPNSGLLHTYGSTSMALADFDGDGDLDLYVTNYRTTNYKDRPPGVKPQARRVDGQVVVTPADRFMALQIRRTDGVMLIEKGEPDQFYKNDGKGHFEPVPWTDGTFLDEQGAPLKEPPLEWGLSVLFRDLNGDGKPDLYICNDFIFSKDRLWLNDGHGHFRLPAQPLLGTMSMSSMSIDVADINRDGFDDFFVADMLSREHAYRHLQRANVLKGEITLPIHDPRYVPEFGRNTLHLNRGDGTFAEIAHLAGLEATEWTWGCVFLDVDLDGFEDLLIVNGNGHDVLNADAARAVTAAEREGRAAQIPPGVLSHPRLPRTSLAFRNRGDLTFEDIGASWGFQSYGIAQGMVLADLDGDGDQDVILNRMNGEAMVYRNDTSAPRLAVRLQGRSPNTQGVGAKIRVLGGPVTQTQSIQSGGRYLGGDDAMRTFATRSNSEPLSIEVTWRSGAQSRLTSLKPNSEIIVQEPAHLETSVSDPSKSNSEVGMESMFEDQSRLLEHLQEMHTLDDFQAQPMLPYKLSQLGPGLTWFDVDGDQREDLVIGAAPAKQVSVWLHPTLSSFRRWSNLPPENIPLRPQTTVLGWNNGLGAALLLAACANDTDGGTNGALLRVFDFAKGTAVDGWRARTVSPGPTVLADFDGDGDLDLFIGGRVLAGRYPYAGPSYLYWNDHGRFRPDPTNSVLFQKAGLVSGAIATDVDGDGQPDLVLACEWGPLRIYRNQHGGFREVSDTWGTHRIRGWWNGVAAGDFDGDGRMDLIASNWGRNTKYQRHLSHPLRLYFGNAPGSELPLLEAYFEPGLGHYAPSVALDDLAKVFPEVNERFDSFRAYANATIESILGSHESQSTFLEADTLDTMIFWNRGNHFEAQPLPVEAQMSPAFGIAVADFDGNGTEDIFLSQNFFGVPVETSRYDAGRGLMLLNQGSGHWTPLSTRASGVNISGQQRGAAVCDWDADGRMDLAVVQLGGETKLYRNRSANPGVRVHLQGPQANPSGIGAVVRPLRKGNLGPAHEWHAGSGYWSQDSAVAVVARQPALTALSVRWPGGELKQYEIPSNATEVWLDKDRIVRSSP